MYNLNKKTIQNQGVVKLLKGINKQILEVTNTESPYFEKIIFFVRTASPEKDENKLREEAEKIASKMKKPPRLKRSFRRFAKSCGYVFLGVGTGWALSYLLSGLI